MTFWIIIVIGENAYPYAYLAVTGGHPVLFTVAGAVPALNAGILVFFVLYRTTENV